MAFNLLQICMIFSICMQKQTRILYNSHQQLLFTGLALRPATLKLTTISGATHVRLEGRDGPFWSDPEAPSSVKSNCNMSERSSLPPFIEFIPPIPFIEVIPPIPDSTVICERPMWGVPKICFTLELDLRACSIENTVGEEDIFVSLDSSIKAGNFGFIEECCGIYGDLPGQENPEYFDKDRDNSVFSSLLPLLWELLCLVSSVSNIGEQGSIRLGGSTNGWIGFRLGGRGGIIPKVGQECATAILWPPVDTFPPLLMCIGWARLIS